jgi:hypothetical protein
LKRQLCCAKQERSRNYSLASRQFDETLAYRVNVTSGNAFDHRCLILVVDRKRGR